MVPRSRQASGHGHLVVGLDHELLDYIEDIVGLYRVEPTEVVTEALAHHLIMMDVWHHGGEIWVRKPGEESYLLDTGLRGRP